MVQRMNPPQPQCDHIVVRYELLLGLEDSKRDSAESASPLSENAKAKTARFISGISKVSPYSVK